jgi:DNA-directed RNA polymerase alpha subunit
MAETGMTFDEEEDEEPKEDEKKGKKGKKAKVEEVDPEELKRRQAVAAKAKDIATYGVRNQIDVTFMFSVPGFGKTTMRRRTKSMRCGCLAQMVLQGLMSLFLKTSRI